MRIGDTYTHLNGLEYLMVHEPDLWSEIQSVIADVDAEICRTKISREKTKTGRTLYYPPIDMNAEFKNRFTRRNWTATRTSYWVTEDARLIRRTM